MASHEEGQALNTIAKIATDTPWNEVDRAATQRFLELRVEERGRRILEFLNRGGEPERPMFKLVPPTRVFPPVPLDHRLRKIIRNVLQARRFNVGPVKNLLRLFQTQVAVPYVRFQRDADVLVACRELEWAINMGDLLGAYVTIRMLYENELNPDFEFYVIVAFGVIVRVRGLTGGWRFGPDVRGDDDFPEGSYYFFGSVAET